MDPNAQETQAEETEETAAVETPKRTRRQVSERDRLVERQVAKQIRRDKIGFQLQGQAGHLRRSPGTSTPTIGIRSTTTSPRSTRRSRSMETPASGLPASSANQPNQSEQAAEGPPPAPTLRCHR